MILDIILAIEAVVYSLFYLSSYPYKHVHLVFQSSIALIWSETKNYIEGNINVCFNKTHFQRCKLDSELSKQEIVHMKADLVSWLAL
jgi:hypothetical protein